VDFERGIDNDFGDFVFGHDNLLCGLCAFARNIKQGTDEFCVRRIEQVLNGLMTPTKMSILS